MNTQNLPACDWNVPRSQENPLSCPLSSMEFPISGNKYVNVTNAVASVRFDTWFVFQCTKVEVADSGLAVVLFVAERYTQTDALNAAREYAWLVFKKDIFSDDLPF